MITSIIGYLNVDERYEEESVFLPLVGSYGLVQYPYYEYYDAI